MMGTLVADLVSIDDNISLSSSYNEKYLRQTL